MKKSLLNTGFLLLLTISLTGCYTIIMDSPDTGDDNSTTIIINYPPAPLPAPDPGPIPYPVPSPPIQRPVEKSPGNTDSGNGRSGKGSSNIRRNDGGRTPISSRHSEVSQRRTGTVERGNSNSTGRTSGNTGSGSSNNNRNTKSTDNGRHR